MTRQGRTIRKAFPDAQGVGITSLFAKFAVLHKMLAIAPWVHFQIHIRSETGRQSVPSRS